MDQGDFVPLERTDSAPDENGVQFQTAHATFHQSGDYLLVAKDRAGNVESMEFKVRADVSALRELIESFTARPLSYADYDLVTSANEQYQTLAAADQAQLSDLEEALTDAAEYLNSRRAAVEAVKTLIAGLPGPDAIRFPDQEQYVRAYQAYRELDGAEAVDGPEREAVGVPLAEKLSACQSFYEKLEQAISEIGAGIDELARRFPKPENLRYEDGTAILELYQKYDAFERRAGPGGRLEGTLGLIPQRDKLCELHDEMQRIYALVGQMEADAKRAVGTDPVTGKTYSLAWKNRLAAALERARELDLQIGGLESTIALLEETAGRFTLVEREIAELGGEIEERCFNKRDMRYRDVARVNEIAKKASSLSEDAAALLNRDADREQKLLELSQRADGIVAEVETLIARIEEELGAKTVNYGQKERIEALEACYASLNLTGNPLEADRSAQAAVTNYQTLLGPAVSFLRERERAVQSLMEKIDGLSLENLTYSQKPAVDEAWGGYTALLHDSEREALLGREKIILAARSWMEGCEDEASRINDRIDALDLALAEKYGVSYPGYLPSITQDDVTAINSVKRILSDFDQNERYDGNAGELVASAKRDKIGEIFSRIQSLVEVENAFLDEVNRAIRPGYQASAENYREGFFEQLEALKEKGEAMGDRFGLLEEARERISKTMDAIGKIEFEIDRMREEIKRYAAGELRYRDREKAGRLLQEYAGFSEDAKRRANLGGKVREVERRLISLCGEVDLLQEEIEASLRGVHVNYGHKDAVGQLMKRYQSLNEIDGEADASAQEAIQSYPLLLAASNLILELDQTVRELADQIDAIPSPVPYSAKYAVEKAGADLERLKERDPLAAQAIGQDRRKALELAGRVIESRVKEIARVQALIDALPTAQTVTSQNKTQITEAQAAYEGLAGDEKAEIQSAGRIGEAKEGIYLVTLCAANAFIEGAGPNGRLTVEACAGDESVSFAVTPYGQYELDAISYRLDRGGETGEIANSAYLPDLLTLSNLRKEPHTVMISFRPELLSDRETTENPAKGKPNLATGELALKRDETVSKELLDGWMNAVRGAKKAKALTITAASGPSVTISLDREPREGLAQFITNLNRSGGTSVSEIYHSANQRIHSGVSGENAMLASFNFPEIPELGAAVDVRIPAQNLGGIDPEKPIYAYYLPEDGLMSERAYQAELCEKPVSLFRSLFQGQKTDLMLHGITGSGRYVISNLDLSSGAAQEPEEGEFDQHRRAAQSGYWREMERLILSSSPGDTLEAVIQEGAYLPAYILDRARDNKTNLIVTQGEQSLLILAGEIPEAPDVVWYRFETLEALRQGSSKAIIPPVNPGTGGIVTRIMPRSDPAASMNPQVAVLHEAVEGVLNPRAARDKTVPPDERGKREPEGFLGAFVLLALAGLWTFPPRRKER